MLEHHPHRLFSYFRAIPYSSVHHSIFSWDSEGTPIFFCSHRDCMTRESWPLSKDGAFGKVAAVHFPNDSLREGRGFHPRE